MTYLDSRPGRLDLLTSREVASLLGGLFAGLSMTYGREVLRSAILALVKGDVPVNPGHELVNCTRLIAAMIGLASNDPIRDAMTFWSSADSGAQAIDALPEKEKDHGSSSN